MAAVVFIAKNREKAKRKRREGIFGFIFKLKKFLSDYYETIITVRVQNFYAKTQSYM